MVSGIGRARATLVAFTLAVAVAVVGCGGSGAGPTGTGGAAGNGAAGTTTGAAGSAGAGGAPGTDGATADAASSLVTLFDFATLAQLASVGVANSGDTNVGDLGVHPSGVDGGGLATVSWDGQVGAPDPGSVQIQMPCNAYGQFVDYQFILPIISDMGGKTVSLMLRLDSGFSPGGYVLLYAKSGDNWDWGQATAAAIAPTSAGQWVKYTFAMSALGAGSSANFDPGYVKSVGVQINTGAGTGATAPPTPAVFHLDTIGYQ
jgi:hypothetical protein